MEFKGFYKDIIFDVDRPLLQAYTAKQGDTKSRGFYVTVLQNNTVMPITNQSMTLYAEKPDKTRVFIDAVKEDNRFRIDLTNQVFAVVGKVKCEMALKGSSGEVISNKAFIINVDRTLQAGSIISEDELSDFAQLQVDFTQHKLDYIQQRQQDQLKVAKIEKELNDYKTTMQQVNINQEPKQKATGHGVISLPPNAANGQVSVSIFGNTETDEEGGTKSTISAMRVKAVGKNLDSVRELSLNSGGRILGDKIFVNGKRHFYRYVAETKHRPCFKAFDINGNEIIEGLNDFVSPKTWEYWNVGGILAWARTGDENANEYLWEFMANPNVAYIQWGLQSSGNAKITSRMVSFENLPYEPYTESNAYVVAKDSAGKITELRSLPNGTKDEVNVTSGVKIQRVSDWVQTDSSTIASYDNTSGENNDFVNIPKESLNISHIPIGSIGNESVMILSSTGEVIKGTLYADRDNINNRGKFYIGATQIGFIVEKGAYTDLSDARRNFPIYTLTYQLAEPVEIPIQVSGTLTGHPSGTVYIEPIVADAGVYTDKIEVLHQDLPIKALEKLSKVDFMTGVETELDIDGIVIAENKLSFTHPELQDGDIVFFEYEYDVESTIPETEIEHYDSRYTIKDSVTDKFYKWNVAVTDGVPSIELVEV